MISISTRIIDYYLSRDTWHIIIVVHYSSIYSKYSTNKTGKQINEESRFSKDGCVYKK